MRKLQISKEHRALIESVIRENPKFKGHEKLIDFFCEAIYRKSYLLIDAIRDMSRLRRHLSMISDSCMEQIIKEKKKYDNTKLYDDIMRKSRYKKEIVSLKKEKNVNQNKSEFEQNVNKSGIVSLKEEIQRSEKYDAVGSIIDPLEFYPKKKFGRETVEKLAKIIRKIDKQYPQKRYYEMFSLRYIKKYSQTDMARILKASQIELSKRFIELVSIVKDNV